MPNAQSKIAHVFSIFNSLAWFIFDFFGKKRKVSLSLVVNAIKKRAERQHRQAILVFLLLLEASLFKKKKKKGKKLVAT